MIKLALLLLCIASLVAAAISGDACPVGYEDAIEGGDRCYKAIEQKATWQEAMDYCLIHNSTLMHVDDASDNELLSKYFSKVYNNTKGFYMWLAMKQTGPDWVWKLQPEEDVVKYTQWDALQPNNLETLDKVSQNCASIKTTRFRWNDLDCQEKASFACMTRKTACPDGYENWFRGSNFCYKIHQKKLSRKHARSNCHWNNAALIRTTNKSVLRVIVEKMKEAGVSSVWTDLKSVTKGSEKQWVWQSTHEMSDPMETPWAPSQGEKDVFANLHTDGMFYSQPATATSAYVCMKTKGRY